MELTWVPEAEDIIDALARRRVGRAQRVLFRVVIGFPVALMLLLLVAGLYERAWTTVGSSLLALAAGIGALLMIHRFTPRQLGRRLFASDPALRSTRHAAVDDEGIRVSHDSDWSLHSWNEVVAVLESDRSFVLGLQMVTAVHPALNGLARLNAAASPGATLLLPKRALRDDAEVARLRRLLVERTGNSARVRVFSGKE